MITYKTYTDIGEREVNEDSIGEYQGENGTIFVLADGLGGHGHGEVASSLVVKTALEMYAGRKESVSGEQFAEMCFKCAQDMVTLAQNENRTFMDMKTTMVTLIIENGKILWGHIGDSRLYYFKNNKLVSRTLDHSVPQMLVSTKEIKEKDIRGHEDRNRLLRVIGSPWINNRGCDISAGINEQQRQAFLLCSDGFWEQITEKEMCHCLKKSDSVDKWLDDMCGIVKANGKGKNMDNNSAIAVWVN